MSETSIPALISHLGQSDRVVAVINPSTAKPLYELPQHSAEQVELVIEKARAIMLPPMNSSIRLAATERPDQR